MRCPHCGSENQDALFRCPRCGEVLEYYGGPVEEEEAAGDAARPPRPHVPSNLVLAIVTTFVCGCVPLGVVAIVYAAQVQGKLDRGDIQGARAASSTARTLSLIGIIGMVVIAFGYAMLMFATVSVHD